MPMALQKSIGTSIHFGLLHAYSRESSSHTYRHAAAFQFKYAYRKSRRVFPTAPKASITVIRSRCHVMATATPASSLDFATSWHGLARTSGYGCPTFALRARIIDLWDSVLEFALCKLLHCRPGASTRRSVRRTALAWINAEMRHTFPSVRHRRCTPGSSRVLP